MLTIKDDADDNTLSGKEDELIKDIEYLINVKKFSRESMLSYLK